MIFQHPVQLLSYPSHDKFIYLRVYDLYIKIVSYKKKNKNKNNPRSSSSSTYFQVQCDIYQEKSLT